MESSWFSTEADKFGPGQTGSRQGLQMDSTAPREARPSEVIWAQRLPGRPVSSFRSLTRPPAASPEHPSPLVPTGWSWRD